MPNSIATRLIALLSLCSALILGLGMLVDYHHRALEEGAFDVKRTQQNRDWMHQLVNEMLMLKLSQNPEVKRKLPALEQGVEDRQITAYAAARQIIEEL